MSNNILEPIPSNLNDYLLKYRVITLSNTTPAAPGGNTNITFQMDGFGNISAYSSSSGASLSLKTNGVANGSQSILNIAQGSNITAIDNGSGTVTLSAPNGASVGSANAVQIVGATAGSFAASTLSQNSVSEVTQQGDFTVNNTFQVHGSTFLGGAASTFAGFTADVLSLSAQPTTASASAGTGSALPALPAGYITISINSTSQKIAYFNV